MKTCDRYYSEGQYKCKNKYYISCDKCGNHSEVIAKAKRKHQKEFNAAKKKAKLYDKLINKNND